ncbi:leader peptidase (prepilin peptidase) / N-methyltransferase [Sulfitobacter brevis]|uniref:Prepilin leader peptidase/N-methyltransferase n=1 Tax=Sulfitobacter brevis TaxID=74348 RepID=A0A1I2GK67_9RHOB|nr:A24 family peptidase [Sulfitobacter brevis]SFF17217.1 leader peptidase (prepilin peptidase) / N-methyltransferase [Sulfitobacter brevis]
MPELTFFNIAILLLSPLAGWALAVMIDRLPRDEGLIAPSRCRACETRLPLSQIIPLASFVLQRGRCKACAAAIPAWQFYVEIIATGAAVLAVAQGGGPVLVLLTYLMLWLLLGLAAADLLWFRLPDVLTGALAGVAFGLALLPGGIGLTASLMGAAVGAGSFAALRWAYWALRGIEGLGLGDVKLMVGLGALVGPRELPLLVLIAAVAALVVALAGRYRDATSLDAYREIQFGTALCFAAAILWGIGPVMSLPF